MDLGEEDSAAFGTLRIPSSSTAPFFSASNSPLSPSSAAHLGSLGHDTNINMDSLDTDWQNPDSEYLTGVVLASGEVDPVAEACTSSDPRRFENASSSTKIYNSALSGYGVHRSSVRHKSRGKKIGRLLEISAPPPATFSSNRLRSYDVFIGFHGRKPLLLRFANWLRAELEVQGLSCFVTDRWRCRSSRKHSIVERAMDASTFGVVILTRKSFRNPYTIEELRFFSSKKNLVPLYFDVAPNDCLVRDIIEKRGEVWEKYGGELWLVYGGVEKEWREAVSALSCVDEWKLEAHDGRWRHCILRGVTLLALRLGRRSVVDRLTKWREKAEREEFPFPQNESFVGRRKELAELEFMLFGDVCGDAERDYFDLKARPRRKKLAVEREGKGKQPVWWKESEKEIEMQNTQVPQKLGMPRRRSMRAVYGKGIACVTGDPGIGKTELVLEYAYRFHQKYKMVLWIGGESRYIRQNYLNLWSFLEVDVGVESCTERGQTRSFEEQEEAAIARIRKELMRNIPFLVIIDNLEMEKDWWDHKMVMDLLPRFGGETHVIISTRLSNVMNLEPLRVSFLSGVEAMTLMQGGGLKDESITEMDALRAIEEKLQRLTLGLAIVGAILSELPINPTRLLDTINRMPWRDITWSGRGNQLLRRNTFLVQLFEVCFSIFDHADGQGSLATRMVLASGWFAPGPVPVHILALAAQRIPEKQPGWRLWQKIMCPLTCGLASSYARRSEGEASSLLLRFNMARSCTKEGCIKLSQLVKVYARKRGVPGAADAMVQAVVSRASVAHHPDHVWAACFLLLGFRKDPIVVELKVTQLLLLVKQLVLPLAVRTFVTFSRCGAAVELLRLCTDVLEAADEAFATPVEKWMDKSLCWRPIHTKAHLNPYLWQELALTRATVLEVRAKLAARGGQLDVADDLIRKSIFVRTSICGRDHPHTIAAQETLTKFTRLSANLQHHTP